MSKQNRESGAPHISGQANTPLSLPPHALSCEVFLAELAVNSEHGLSSHDADERLRIHGHNELDNGPGVQPLKILVKQIANAMILVKPSTVLLHDHSFSDPVLPGLDSSYDCQFWHWLVY
jgi:Na+-exporting ATPase